MMLSDVCLSAAYIGNNSRTERLGTQVAHSDTTFKVKRSKLNLQGRGNIVVDSRKSLIFINSLIFMALTGSQLLEVRRTRRRRRKGWAANGPQRPAYSVLCHHVHSLLCPRP